METTLCHFVDVPWVHEIYNDCLFNDEPELL